MAVFCILMLQPFVSVFIWHDPCNHRPVDTRLEGRKQELSHPADKINQQKIFKLLSPKVVFDAWKDKGETRKSEKCCPPRAGKTPLLPNR